MSSYSESNPNPNIGTSDSPHTDYRHLEAKKLTPMYQDYVEV